MAITSIGYDGTITESQWALMSQHMGTPYAVAGPNDFAVTSNVGATLTVNVATGTVYGYGVMDTNTAQAPIALAAIASGTRWDLIALRRNWTNPTPGGASSIVAITGGATQVLPSRNTTPGNIDDQPLALVQVTAGQTTPTSILDLRSFPGKVVSANSLMAIDPAPRGIQAFVNGTHYRRDYDNTQNLAWLPDVAVIPVGTDLNSMTTAGTFYQGSNANATTALNYPPDNAAGWLEVFQPAGTPVNVEQRYTSYGHSGRLPRNFIRGSNVSGSWSPWMENVQLRDSGWVSTGFSPATGFAISDCRYRNLNYVTYLYCRVQLTQATSLTADASGNIADTPCLTIPAAGRPVDDNFTDFRGSNTNGELQITASTGVVTIVSMNTSSAIAQNNIISFTTSFPTT